VTCPRAARVLVLDGKVAIYDENLR